MKRIKVEERTQADSFGCSNWLGVKNKDGYGKWGSRLAHRVVYESFYGTIADGLWIDHLCGNRACVRIEHLEAVTPWENLHRSPYTLNSINAAKTCCPRGHPYDDLNTYRDRTGFRHCRACRRVETQTMQGNPALVAA